MNDDDDELKLISNLNVKSIVNENSFYYSNKDHKNMESDWNEFNSESHSLLKRKSVFFQKSVEKKKNNEYETTNPLFEKIILDKKKLYLIKPTEIPCKFTAKYLGKTNCSGFNGASNTRQPVDEIVNGICTNNTTDLAVVSLTLNRNILDISEHKLNEGPKFESLIISTKSISFAIQDPKYCRILAFIEAKKLSQYDYLTECHVINFPDPYLTRQFVLTMQMVFNINNSNDRKTKNYISLENSYDLDTESYF